MNRRSFLGSLSALTRWLRTQRDLLVRGLNEIGAGVLRFVNTGLDWIVG